MPDFAAAVELARDLGPLAALALLFAWWQNRTASRLLDAVLVEIKALRTSTAAAAASQAETVGELRGLRRDLGRAEAQVELVSGRSTAQAEQLAELGATVRDHGRRLDALEVGRAASRE